MSAQQGQQWLDFSKQTYEETKPRQAAMDELSMQVARQGLSASQFQDTVAREQYADYQRLGKPAVERMYADAASYGSAENQEIAAQEAGAAVQQQLAVANAGNQRAMTRMGVNPNSGVAAAVGADQALQGAVAGAGAMTAARKGVRDQGIMLTKDAASYAGGQSGTAAQTFQASGNSGMTGVSALGAAGALQQNSTQIMNQGFQGAQNGQRQSADILNADYANRLKSYQISSAESSANTGAVLGTVGMVAGAVVF